MHGPVNIRYVCILTKDGKNREDVIWVKEAKVTFNSKQQPLCSNNLSLEIKNKPVKSCIWSVAVCGSETGTVGKNEGRVVNAFETWCWRRMLNIKWTERVKEWCSFSESERRKITFKNLKKIDPTHGKGIQLDMMSLFVVNSLEGAISGEKGLDHITYSKFARNTGPESYIATEIMTWNDSRSKTANLSKDWRIRRRRKFVFSLCLHLFRPSVQTHNDNNKCVNAHNDNKKCANTQR